MHNWKQRNWSKSYNKFSFAICKPSELVVVWTALVSIRWLWLSGSQSLQMLDIIQMIELEMARNQPLIDVCTPPPPAFHMIHPRNKFGLKQDEVKTYPLHPTWCNATLDTWGWNLNPLCDLSRSQHLRCEISASL